MKILHTADWHLGNTFHGHDRTLEHRHFLKWLLDVLTTRQPDALIIAGDIFDTPNPPAKAEELFFDFLSSATSAVKDLQIIVTAGNHDSGARLEAPNALLRSHGVYVRGLMRFDDKGEPDTEHYILPLAPRGQSEAECVCLAMPYLRGADYPAGLTPQQGLAWHFDRLHSQLRSSAFGSLPVVVAAHFYATGADVVADEHSERLVVGGQDCVDVSVVGRQVSYVALGHIHRSQQVGGAPNAFYAGSALPMSFAERSYTHGVQLIDLDLEGHASVSRMAYEPLRHLYSIPSQTGSAATAQEVMQAINQLPRRTKDDAGDDWPYLEIRLHEEQPEPTLLHDVMQALDERAVHFCRMVRERASANNLADGAHHPLSPEQLKQAEPINMARAHFRARYGADMPEQLITRFAAAEQLNK